MTVDEGDRIGDPDYMRAGARATALKRPTTMVAPFNDQTRRKRLYFHAWHRGMRELDLILGRFADQYLATLEGAALDAFERILGRTDAELYQWLTGQEPIPAALDGPVMASLCTACRDGRLTP